MTSLRPPLATGYTLILPPGWLRLDARTDGGIQELDAELDKVLSTVPRDSYGPLVAEARKQAQGVLEQARNAGALDLYLPLGGMHGSPLPASFLVSMVQFDHRPPAFTASPDPEAASMQIAALLAVDLPDGEVKQMPAGIAVRSRRVIPAAGASSWAGARVDYQWPMPSQPTKWALVSFTTMGGGKPDDDIAELDAQVWRSEIHRQPADRHTAGVPPQHAAVVHVPPGRRTDRGDEQA